MLSKSNNFARHNFDNILCCNLENKFSTFENKICKKIESVTMGSLLGPSLHNAFLCYHSLIWLNESLEEFTPVYYYRCVDDIFVLFRPETHVTKFVNYDLKNRNVKFTRKEENGSLSLLDILVFRLDKKFTASAYQKSTIKG